MQKLLLVLIGVLALATPFVYGQSAVSAKDLNARGSASLNRGDIDGAIADYSRAIERDPKSVTAYGNRGAARRQKGDLEGALSDLSKAIELNPKLQSSYYARAWVNLFLNHGGAAYDDAIKLLAFKESNYLIFPNHILVGYFGLRQAGRYADADAFLASGKPKLLASEWTTRIIAYLKHEISEEQLLAAASGNKAMTEARTYVGMDQSLSGKPFAALPNLHWVVANGDKRTYEYTLAYTVLKRLETPPATKKQ
jgi:tetratricopeptide (TPR) repeat protein